MTNYEKKKNTHKVGTINGKNKISHSISKDLFVSFLQTPYRTYIHLYINISVRKETCSLLLQVSLLHEHEGCGIRSCCKGFHGEGT